MFGRKPSIVLIFILCTNILSSMILLERYITKIVSMIMVVASIYSLDYIDIIIIVINLLPANMMVD